MLLLQVHLLLDSHKRPEPDDSLITSSSRPSNGAHTMASHAARIHEFMNKVFLFCKLQYHAQLLVFHQSALVGVELFYLAFGFPLL